MRRLMRSFLAGLILVLTAVSPGIAKEHPSKQNELRLSWFVMPGYARRVGGAGKDKGVWISYDGFSATAPCIFCETRKISGQWALASIRSESPRKRGGFWELGTGYGRIRKTSFVHTVRIHSGIGWMLAAGYRFTPTWRLDLREYGADSGSTGPWLTFAADF